MDTGIYEYFLAVERTGNISHAAVDCFITQPTLTHHIKSMEKKLGFTIFQMKDRHLVPTPEGRLFLDAARRIVQVEKETLTSIEEYKTQNLQTFRICTDNHLRDPIIEKVIPKYQCIYPNLSISVIASETSIGLEMLQKQQVHIGIFPVQEHLPAGIEHSLLEISEYKLVVSPEHPLIPALRQHGIQPELLKNETFIFNSNYSLIGKMQMQILKQYNITPDNREAVPLMTKIAELVYHRKGISFLPDYMTTRCGFPLESFSFDPPWYFQHVLAWHESTTMKRYHADLIRLLSGMFD